MADLKTLIGYIVDQVTDRNGVVGRTSLMKLVYLVDVEHCRRFGKQATGLKWRFHHYGPYTHELDPAINPFGNYLDEREFTWTAKDEKASGYRYTQREDWREIETAFNANYSAPIKRSVDNVIERWGLESLHTILDYVYFETEPMQGAKRGEYLDFSKVERDSSPIEKTGKVRFSEDFLNGLHSRLKERKDNRNLNIRKATEPVYDEVYESALKAMGEEEGANLHFQTHIRIAGPGLE